MYKKIPMDFQIDSNIKFVLILTVTFNVIVALDFLNFILKNITGSIFECF